jgi:hypothetical protein
MRIFPHALAHCVVNTPAGDVERHMMLLRHFNRLSPSDKLECRAEIVQAKRGKRGELEAAVA